MPQASPEAPNGITEALSDDILRARMPVAGKLMYGLQ